MVLFFSQKKPPKIQTHHNRDTLTLSAGLGAGDRDRSPWNDTKYVASNFFKRHIIALQPRLAWSSWSSCLSLWKTGTTKMKHHAWLWTRFWRASNATDNSLNFQWRGSGRGVRCVLEPVLEAMQKDSGWKGCRTELRERLGDPEALESLNVF
jgi:hypothetical protein